VLGAANAPSARRALRQLPFTGLMLSLVALVGALLTSVGLGLRSYART
jgi:hypothetical protein